MTLEGLLDRGLDVLYVSPQIERLLGYPSENWENDSRLLDDACSTRTTWTP